MLVGWISSFWMRLVTNRHPPRTILIFLMHLLFLFCLSFNWNLTFERSLRCFFYWLFSDVLSRWWIFCSLESSIFFLSIVKAVINWGLWLWLLGGWASTLFSFLRQFNFYFFLFFLLRRTLPHFFLHNFLDLFAWFHNAFLDIDFFNNFIKVLSDNCYDRTLIWFLLQQRN